MTEVLVCDICQNRIEVDQTGRNGGHDAYPVTEGRCCTECNKKFVIPMRFMIRNEKKAIFQEIQFIRNTKNLKNRIKEHKNGN